MEPIKVVHVVGASLASGAGRGAFSLHRGLRAIGVDSVVLSDSAIKIDDPHVRCARGERRDHLKALVRTVLDGAPLRLYPRRQRALFSPGIAGYPFHRHPSVRTADVVHLHWVNGAFVNVRDLARVGKPVVWTLRDMWPITGGCHYAMGCERFTVACGECPQLGSGRRRDLSWWCARRKLRSFPIGTTFVAQSAWLADEARRSAITAGREIVKIGNAVSCDEFFPIDRECARRTLGLKPRTRKVLLAGAQNVRDFYKGYDAFLGALDRLDRSAYLIVLFGHGGAADVERLGFEVKDLGFLSDTISLRSVYCAADVFVAPSRMEAFGKTIAEAMACNRPVVCFDATGPRDIVDHQVSGFRAAPFDPASLAAGIEWVTADADRWVALGAAARAKVQRTYDPVVVARQYADLYARVLSRGVGAA